MDEIANTRPDHFVRRIHWSGLKTLTAFEIWTDPELEPSGQPEVIALHVEHRSRSTDLPGVLVDEAMARATGFGYAIDTEVEDDTFVLTIRRAEDPRRSLRVRSQEWRDE